MLTVFYGEQIYATYETWGSLSDLMRDNAELRNSAYIHAPLPKGANWYRGDFTPCLIVDVPPVLRTMMLLLGE